MLIDATKSSLLIVDVQERLLPVMAAGNSVVERSKILAGCGSVTVGEGC